MSAAKQWQKTTSDPLGLGKLEDVEPGFDGWAGIESALTSHHRRRQAWRRTGGWLAVAASLVLVISLTMSRQPDVAPAELTAPAAATLAANSASVSVQANIDALINLSQTMEEQLRQIKQESGSMPAESAIYVVEIEDLIAQVDGELTLTPGSVDLWGQRVNLMLDLAQIYQQQWEIDYGRMASL